MRDAVERWMQHYITAWTTNDPEDIRALFTEDAVYATSPQEPEPWKGREQSWNTGLPGATSPTTGRSSGKLLGVDGGRAFVQGLTSYRGNSRSYDNLWVIQLTADGRASSFTEWYMQRK